MRVARKELEASIVESDKQISELKKEIRELGARRDVLQTGARMET